MRYEVASEIGLGLWTCSAGIDICYATSLKYPTRYTRILHSTAYYGWVARKLI